MIRFTGSLHYKRLFFTFLFLLLLILGSFGQVSNTDLGTRDEILTHTNKVYGSDDILINGRIYVPLHSLAEGHPYFETLEWVHGDLFIKGNHYVNVKLKYDIELDEFILSIKDKQERKNYIVLNRHYVDTVYMGKYVFVNTKELQQINQNIGYAELVFEKDFIFLIKYSKDFKKEYSESKPYGEYNKVVANRFISESGDLIKLNTKKSFLDYFESNKKEIKKYMKKNKIKYRKAKSGELNKLLNHCHEVRNK